MTDTDDTDDLLLIPPDFFTIESDLGTSNIDPYYNIVGSLIEQVGNLQTRIKSIESSESFITISPEASISNSRMQKRDFRKYNSTDDIYLPSSTQSTPQKPHSKFKLNSLPPTPYLDKHYIEKNLLDMKSPSPSRNKQSHLDKSENNTLSEVDTFLSKVKTIKRHQAVRNLEHEFQCNDTISTASKCKEPEEVIEKNSIIVPNVQMENIELPSTKQKFWQAGDNRESVPDYGYGVRDQLLPQREKSLFNDMYQSGDQNYVSGDHNLNLSSLTNNSFASESRYIDSESSTSDTISQVTAFKNFNKSQVSNDPIHTNALKILNEHKQLTENNAKKTLKKSQREIRSSKQSELNENLKLLNLADIWNTTNSQILQLSSSQLLQKIHEEKLRRQV